MASKTLAERFADDISGDPSIVAFQAHGDLVAGNCVHLAMATGISAAPADNDRELFLGVVLEAVSSGEIGRAKVQGLVQALSGAAIAVGQLCDVSSDMKCDPLGAQTDGNGSLKALEAATGADELIWCRII